MELTNEFHVGLPVADAWAVLTDLERIAPCLPGAAIESIDDDEFTGNVKIKVGPLTAQYRGTARFLERDDTAHRAVVRAEGRETRGQGNAAATITLTIAPDPAGSTVSVATELTITGKVAQFGRGVLAEVSAKLLGQFVERLESDLAADRRSVSEPGVEALRPSSRPAAAAAGTVPVNLISTVGLPIAKRALPGVAIALALCWLLLRRRRHRTLAQS